MKKSVFWKLLTGHLLIIFLLSITTLLFSASIIRNHYLHTLSDNLENFSLVFRSQVVSYHTSNRFEALDSLVKHTGHITGTRITVIAPSGTVLADSERDPKTMENHRMRAEIARALEGEVGQSIRFSRTVKEEMLYVAVPAYVDGDLVCVVRSSMFLSDINHLLSTLIVRIIYMIIFIIVLALLLAMWFSRGMSRPIRELVHASRKVADGDFDVTVLFKKQDELKELADSFNHMVAQIKTLITEQSREKAALNAIISSIREGVLVLDKKGKVLLSNASFNAIVNTPSAVDRPYWEMIRNPQLNELIDKITQAEHTSLSTEITLNNRHFMCSASFLSSAEQIVLTFHDITEIMRIATMKKDFVQNVSHELRTPLTAIKGFAETLEDEKEIKNKQYLEIIKRHTDRLINIVEDLQYLSKLEEREQLEITKVNISDLIKNVLRMFEHTLKEKHLKTALHLDPDIPEIKADPFKLEQMLINLIDNAVKYTEKGTITISGYRTGSSIVITIEDTGIGIPTSHLDRIFERFYVVDKSRSRTMGGTGLGLSIVKHIVQAHNGDISLTSTLGKGSKFTITLPCA